MGARLEGKGPAEEALLIELRPIISPRRIFLDEIDGRGLNGVRRGMCGEGEAKGESSCGIGGEVANELEVHGHLLVRNYHLSILLASDYKNNQLPNAKSPEQA
jgi:hypothetical protein